MSATMTTGPGTRPAAAEDEDAPVRRRPPVSLVLCSVWVVLVLASTLLAGLLPIAGYDEPVADGATPPFESWPEFLGTDSVGLSVLSRVIHGAQLSLAVALLGTVIGMAGGVALGTAAAYFKGWLATVVNLLSDVVLAFPGLVLLLAMASVTRPSVWSLSAMLGLLSLPSSLRIAYANANVQLGRDYVLAARALGTPAWRMIVREVLPNIAHSLVAFGFVMVATFMIALGALDFLGIGLPPPRPSWGGMIASGFDSIRTRPYLVFVPAAVLLLTVFSFNTIGDRLRERADGRGGHL
ncbi:ABC transporter permease [Microtetraspora fusca]|nr:ABC transporter permease [Microtetraspora fusca]